jgi:uncharacterized protein (TIRG00374 family)
MRPAWRFVLRPVVMLGVLGLAVYVLLPQVDSLGQSIRALRQAQWWMVPAAIVISALSFLGGAISLLGTTNVPLPLWRTVTANLASAFAGRLAPANIGSLGTLGAYLHKQGATVPEATASLGLDAVAGVFVHVALLAISAAAVGQVPHPTAPLPNHWLVGLIVIVGLVLAGVAIAWLAIRTSHRYGDPVRRALEEGWIGLAAAVKSPRQGVRLIGGSILITLSQVGTMYISLLAVRGHTALVTVAFVYLAGSALAAAAPTPGGLGAFEAAAVSGLTLFGTASAPAVAGVLLYRLITFWLPIVPGAVAFKALRSQQYL